MDAPFGLTEKEREALRLLAQGHDVKSAAAALGLSVHTINERLRQARLKTRASSSRGAARLLAEREDPQFHVSGKSGVDYGAATSDHGPRLHLGALDGSHVASRWRFPMLVSAGTAAIIIAATHVFSDRPAVPAAPVVVSTVPTAGAMVEAGRIDLSVTFDRPMRRGNYSFVRKSAATYPDCGANIPVQSADGRTFAMQCKLRPHHRYEVWFNSKPYLNFKDLEGVPARPYRLTFRTR